MRGRARATSTAVLELCEKWEVSGTAIGTVTDSGRMRVLSGGELVGDMPVRALVDDCPLYDLAARRSRWSRSTRRRAACSRPTTPPQRDAAGAAREPEPRLAQAAVRAATTRSCSRAPCSRPEQADAAVLALRRTAARWPCRSTATARRVAADPYRGTIEAVLECAANLACVGAEPLGTTNNLNFGNPEKPHIAWQLTESVRGLGDACRALEAPIVGGNVSLYNEGADGPDLPDAGDRHGRPAARRAQRAGWASTSRATDRAGGRLRALPGRERAGQAARRAAARRAARDRLCRPRVTTHGRGPRGGARGRAASAHDIAEGGLAVALAECCLAGGIGAELLLGEAVGETITPGGTRPRRAGGRSHRPWRRCSARARAASWSAARRGALRALGAHVPVRADRHRRRRGAEHRVDGERALDDLVGSLDVAHSGGLAEYFA